MPRDVEATFTTDDLRIAAVLRGELADPPVSPADVPRLLDAAIQHGVDTLLATVLKDPRHAPTWPVDLRTSLSNRARALAAAEPLRRRELTRVLGGLDAAAVAALVVKGAALAYTHYRQPWERPMVDVDLAVSKDHDATAREVMRALGYRPMTDYDGELATQQVAYERTDERGFRYVVDLHTQLSNPHVFADRLPVDALAARAVAIPALGPAARGLSSVDALMLACIHRVAHHFDSARLIWLYDIHLLVSSLAEGDRDPFVRAAAARGVQAVCARGVGLSAQLLGTEVPASLTIALADVSDEPTAAFLQPGRTKTHVLLSDLRALSGWGRRVHLISEHLFPPAAYIRRLYPAFPTPFLPLAYAHRIVTGVGKWFRHR